MRLRPSNLDEVDVPRTIEVEDGTRVVLTWADGSATTITAAGLRAACECAGCGEPAGEAATAAAIAVPDLVRIIDAKLVGAYALGFHFAPDGHSTGIYPFDRLRRLGDREA